MPGSIGALSADWTDLSVCSWVRAVGGGFSHAGAGDRYADPSFRVHCHPDSDHKIHPNRYPDSLTRAGDRYVAPHAHCHCDSNQDVHPDRYPNSHVHCHCDSNQDVHPDHYPNSRAHCYLDPSA
jgi:hypothetical protein